MANEKAGHGRNRDRVKGNPGFRALSDRVTARYVEKGESKPDARILGNMVANKTYNMREMPKLSADHVKRREKEQLEQKKQAQARSSRKQQEKAAAKERKAERKREAKERKAERKADKKRQQRDEKANNNRLSRLTKSSRLFNDVRKVPETEQMKAIKHDIRSWVNVNDMKRVRENSERLRLANYHYLTDKELHRIANTYQDPDAIQAANIVLHNRVTNKKMYESETDKELHDFERQIENTYDPETKLLLKQVLQDRKKHGGANKTVRLQKAKGDPQTKLLIVEKQKGQTVKDVQMLDRRLKRLNDDYKRAVDQLKIQEDLVKEKGLASWEAEHGVPNAIHKANSIQDQIEGVKKEINIVRKAVSKRNNGIAERRSRDHANLQLKVE